MKTAPVSQTDETPHSPVMVEEAVFHIAPRPGGVYVDATLGMGGHASAIVSSAGEGARLIGIDADGDSARVAERRLGHLGDRVSVFNTNFTGIKDAVSACGESGVDGIIADLGISSRQIARSGRGFSFNADEPLDMRMDTDLEITASDIVNTMSTREIATIIKKYGEDRFARRIASEIVKSREKEPISTSLQLARIVSGAVPAKFHRPSLHPATKTFQALRIKVNGEIDNLEIFLHKAVPLLNKGARIVVICFHSLEDRVVKRFFNFMSAGCVCPPDLPQCGCGKEKTLKVITRRPVLPSPSEISRNPRARSSKMRVGERV